MTYETFIKKFKKGSSFDKYWFYIISILTIGLGFFFIYLINFTDWYDRQLETSKDPMPKGGIYIFIGFLFALGLYGFWRVPKTFKMTLIESDFLIAEKNQILEQIVNEFKLTELEREDQYVHFRYIGSFWNAFNIYIFYDTSGFYINVQQIDFGNNGGFIDFGTSKRVTYKIVDKINECLSNKRPRVG